jgi:hypothetical protein
LEEEAKGADGTENQRAISTLNALHPVALGGKA